MDFEQTNLSKVGLANTKKLAPLRLKFVQTEFPMIVTQDDKNYMILFDMKMHMQEKGVYQQI